MGLSEFESESLAPKARFSPRETLIKPSDFKTYLRLRSINVCDSWLDNCTKMLEHYLDYCHWTITQDKTLDYIQKVKKQYPVTYWRKKVLQIRRFLVYLKIDWAKDIEVPPEPHTYNPKHVSQGDLESVLNSFSTHTYSKQLRALILLGSSSGLRAEELYQLLLTDFDLQNRIVRVNHNPRQNQTTKTGRSRVAFFSTEAQFALYDYFAFFKHNSYLKELFSKSHLTRIFRGSPICVKDLRKAFSQTWDRKGGPTSVKKLLMGHSLDVDLQHYNSQSETDLKEIYDKVMLQKPEMGARPTIVTAQVV